MSFFDETKFISAVKKSFQKYKEFGARSPEKLKPIHAFFAATLKDIFGGNYEYHYIGSDNGEMKIDGKYYPKDIDITISKNGNPIFCLGIKFITSNYKQNANNYFECMMGETANIQARGNLPYAQLIILRQKTPYYKKNETEIPSKIEVINDKDIQKYLNLLFDNPQAHRPNYIGIILIDINEKTGKILPANLEENFSKQTTDFLNTKLSLNKFFDDIADYKKYLELS